MAGGRIKRGAPQIYRVFSLGLVRIHISSMESRYMEEAERDRRYMEEMEREESPEGTNGTGFIRLYKQTTPEALDMGRSSRGVFNKQGQVNAADTKNSVSKCSLETSAQV